MSTFYHDSIPTTSGIYRITCTATSKFYVGSAKNLKKRCQEHYYGLCRQDHGNSKLQRAWNKYGSDTFTFEVLEFVLLPEMLTTREQYWFDRLKPFGDKGFNMAPTAGSTLGRKFSPETKEKMRQSQVGRKHTPEARANMGASRIGTKRTPETRARISAAQIGKKGMPGNMHALGHIHTPETRAKMSANSTVKGKPAHNHGSEHTLETKDKIRQAMVGHACSEETRKKMSVSSRATHVRFRKTLIVTNPDGVEYSVVGIRQFCHDHQLDRSTLTRVANGKLSHHKGWKARFPD